MSCDVEQRWGTHDATSASMQASRVLQASIPIASPLHVSFATSIAPAPLKMKPMAWSFGGQVQGRLSPTGSLKRRASRECLTAPHPKHPAVMAAAHNAEPGAADAAAAAAAPADVDVAAVAAKHG